MYETKKVQIKGQKSGFLRSGNQTRENKDREEKSKSNVRLASSKISKLLQEIHRKIYKANKAIA